MEELVRDAIAKLAKLGNSLIKFIKINKKNIEELDARLKKLEKRK